MDSKYTDQPDRQKKYRKRQKSNGLVRFELQVNAKIKKQFDLLVEEVAEELTSPWDPRRRLSIARERVFDEITQGVRHEFFHLKDQITALRAEIRAISPNFFISDDDNQAPLPEAINALPDNPGQLKQILAKTYQELQTEKQRNIELGRKYEQFDRLYQVSEARCEDLEIALEENSIELPPAPVVNFKSRSGY